MLILHSLRTRRRKCPNPFVDPRADRRNVLLMWAISLKLSRKSVKYGLQLLFASLEDLISVYFPLPFFLQDDIDSVIAKGRLISKIADDPAAGNYWLVEVDDGLQPNEEMDESRFGEILGKVEEPIAAPSTRHPPRSRALSVTSIKESKDESYTKDQNGSAKVPELDQSHSSSSNGNGKTAKTKKVNLSDTHASVPSSDASSSPADQKTLVTHEQRGERRLNHPLRDIPRPMKKQKVPKQKEDVVRIPMKTGVLLLYKGIHRRAEFVRKV